MHTHPDASPDLPQPSSTLILHLSLLCLTPSLPSTRGQRFFDPGLGLGESNTPDFAVKVVIDGRNEAECVRCHANLTGMVWGEEESLRGAELGLGRGLEGTCGFLFVMTDRNLQIPSKFLKLAPGKSSFDRETTTVLLR